MTIPPAVYPLESKLYTCELENCPYCGGRLSLRPFLQSSKIVQTLSETLHISHQVKRCQNQVAPSGISYGYDVIAQTAIPVGQIVI